jgi:TolB protein
MLLCLCLLGVTAVLALTLSGEPQAQESHPPRTGLESLPRYPLAETPEAAFAIEAVSVVPASKVTFQSYRDGNWNIYVGNDDGTGQTAVTNHAQPEIHPHLNRGNTAIVYASRVHGHDYEIYRMNADGSNKVALTNNEFDDGNPQWSPDGTKIVFESYRDGQAEIYVMNADGSGQTRLTYSGDFDGMPTWSPDGTKIAFSSRRTGAYRIWVMNADGSNPVQLSNQPYSFRPQWSPDGSKIAYDADGNNNSWQELWLMNADGTNQHEKYSDPTTTSIWAGSWSPDGRFIAFTRVTFIYYQGNWYWNYASIQAIDAATIGKTIDLSQSYSDWSPRWQTSDAQPPVSQIQTLPAISPAPISVRWSGSDSGGSGLRSYDVQVKTGANGPWTNWLMGTTATSGQYPGVGGQTYYFRSRARDNAFNTESWPTTANSSTTVENLPPITFVGSLPRYNRIDQSVNIRWGGSDPGGSGIASYDVQYRIDGGNWVNWQTDTTQTSETFGSSMAGQTYEFRVRAIDRAQNNGSWSVPDANDQITFYSWGLAGTAYDNAGAPVSGVGMMTTPGAFAITANDREGAYAAYIAETTDNYTAAWNKNGYGSLPATAFTGEVNGYTSDDGKLDVFLPPADNLVQNWGFESGSFAAWQPTGIVTAVVTTNTHHTGQYAARLGPDNLFAPTQEVSDNSTWSRSEVMTIDENDTLHLAWIVTNNQQNQLFYAQKPNNGLWSEPQYVATNAYPGIQLILDESSRVHLLWLAYRPESDVVYYSQRSTNGSWSTPIQIGSQTAEYGLQADVDANGIIYAVWPDEYSRVTYTQRNSSGSWSAPVVIGNVNYFSHESVQMATSSTGVVHVIWQKRREEYPKVEKIYYTRRDLNGIWSPTQAIDPTNTWSAQMPQILVDAAGTAHVFWLSGNLPETTLYYTHTAGNGWTVPLPLAEFFNGYSVLADLNGSIHLGWSAPTSPTASKYDIFYMKRNEAGNWSETQNLFPNFPAHSGPPRLATNATGLPQMVWSSWYDNIEATSIYYSRQNGNGGWTQPQNVSSNVEGVVAPGNGWIAVNSIGSPHIVWEDSAYSTSTGIVYYTTQALAEETGDAAVSQIITIPVTMTNPTVSFLYQLAGASSEYGTDLQVEVDDGTAGTPIFTSSEDTSYWQHEWASLSDWSGETVTLTFRLHQEAEQPLLNAYLDEVTVGSSYPDLDVSVNDKAVLPGEQTTSFLTYSNRGGAAASEVTLTYTLPAEMTFISASVPPASTNPLVWHLADLPAKSEEYVIEVTARVNASAPPFTYLTSTAVIHTTDTELEMLNNEAEGNTYTAALVHLPAIFR